MEYTAELFVAFLEKLGTLDKEIRSTFSEADSMVSSRDSKEESEWHEVQRRLSQVQSLRVSKSKEAPVMLNQHVLKFVSVYVHGVIHFE